MKIGRWTLGIGRWKCFTAFLFVFLFSCRQNDPKREYMQAEIKLNVESFVKKRRQECIQAAYDSANKIVDSLIFKQNVMLDSTNQLVKPIKPPKVSVKATIDTAAVKPIIEK